MQFVGVRPEEEPNELPAIPYISEIWEFGRGGSSAFEEDVERRGPPLLGDEDGIVYCSTGWPNRKQKFRLAKPKPRVRTNASYIRGRTGQFIGICSWSPGMCSGSGASRIGEVREKILAAMNEARDPRLRWNSIAVELGSGQHEHGMIEDRSGIPQATEDVWRYQGAETFSFATAGCYCCAVRRSSGAEAPAMRRVPICPDWGSGHGSSHEDTYNKEWWRSIVVTDMFIHRDSCSLGSHTGAVSRGASSPASVHTDDDCYNWAPLRIICAHSRHRPGKGMAWNSHKRLWEWYDRRATIDVFRKVLEKVLDAMDEAGHPNVLAFLDLNTFSRTTAKEIVENHAKRRRNGRTYPHTLCGDGPVYQIVHGTGDNSMRLRRDRATIRVADFEDVGDDRHNIYEACLDLAFPERRRLTLRSGSAVPTSSRNEPGTHTSGTPPLVELGARPSQAVKEESEDTTRPRKCARLDEDLIIPAWEDTECRKSGMSERMTALDAGGGKVGGRIAKLRTWFSARPAPGIKELTVDDAVAFRRLHAADEGVMKFMMEANIRSDEVSDGDILIALYSVAHLRGCNEAEDAGGSGSDADDTTPRFGGDGGTHSSAIPSGGPTKKFDARGSRGSQRQSSEARPLIHSPHSDRHVEVHRPPATSIGLINLPTLRRAVGWETLPKTQKSRRRSALVRDSFRPGPSSH